MARHRLVHGVVEHFGEEMMQRPSRRCRRYTCRGGGAPAPGPQAPRCRRPCSFSPGFAAGARAGLAFGLEGSFPPPKRSPVVIAAVLCLLIQCPLTPPAFGPFCKSPTGPEITSCQARPRLARGRVQLPTFFGVGFSALAARDIGLRLSEKIVIVRDPLVRPAGSPDPFAAGI